MSARWRVPRSHEYLLRDKNHSLSFICHLLFPVLGYHFASCTITCLIIDCEPHTSLEIFIQQRALLAYIVHRARLVKLRITFPTSHSFSEIQHISETVSESRNLKFFWGIFDLDLWKIRFFSRARENIQPRFPEINIFKLSGKKNDYLTF